MKKRILSILLCIFMIIGMMSGFTTTAYASAIPNATYEVPGTNGNIHFTILGNTLTVSGTGAIPDRTLENAGNILGTEYVTTIHGATITEIVVESGITELGNFSFAGFNNVTEITIPESVTEIGTYAFWSMGITSLQLPSSLSSIDTVAILDCPSLTTISFGNDSTDQALTTVSTRFVSGCSKVNLIRFSPSVASILPGALSDVASNTNLSVEAYHKYRGNISYNTDGLNELSDGVVKQYYELAVQNNDTTVIFNPTKNSNSYFTGYYAVGDIISFTVTPKEGYTLTSVSSYLQGAIAPISGTTYAITTTLHGDRIMTTAINPDAIGSVQKTGTMPNNSNITWWVIQVTGGFKLLFSGTGELSVGDNPGWLAGYRDSITSVEIGEGITKISTAKISGYGAFPNYAVLKEVIFPSSLTEIGGSAFNFTDALESVILSSGVKTVGAYAFNNCFKIKQVTLNEGLTSIGEAAFHTAFLDESVSSATVVIPSTVTSIGPNPFLNYGKVSIYNCSSINLNCGNVYFCVPVTTTVTGGSIMLSAPISGYQNYYYYGSIYESPSETVTMTAPSGKVITSIKRSGSELLSEGSEVSSYTYTVVNGSNALDITLEAIPHNITYSDTTGGTILGVATARAGDWVTVTVIPESDLSCTGIYLKIGSSDEVNKITGNSFTMPEDEATISATFAATLELTGTLTVNGTYGQSLDMLVPLMADSSKVVTESGTEVAGIWSFDATQSLSGQSTAASSILPTVGGTTGYTASFTPSVNPENYANTLTTTLVPVITHKALSVTGATAIGKKYDGTKQVNINAVTLDGVINSDDVSVVTTSLTGTLSSADVGNYNYATLPAMTLTGTAAGNYTLTQPGEPVSVSVNITKADPLSLIGSATMIKNHANYTKEIDLTKLDGYPLDCGGTPTFAVIAESPYSGLTSATVDASGKLTLVADYTTNNTTDTVTVSMTGMNNFADSTINVTVNYVNKTPVIITGLTAPTNRVYNGSMVANTDFGTPAFAPETYTGTNLTYTYYIGNTATGSEISIPKDAGTYTVRISIPDLDVNYSGYHDITFTIHKATVTTTVDSKSMTAGGTLPTFTVSYTGIANGDTAEGIFATQAIASCGVGGNAAGSYPIQATMPGLTESAAMNYNVVVPVNGTLTVNNPFTGGGAFPATITDATQPHAGTPLIKDGNKAGWEAIQKQISQTKEGDTVTVEMNGSSVIPKEVFDNIRGRNITLVLVIGEGISWSVNGQNITDYSLEDIDFGVTMDTDAIPENFIQGVAGEQAFRSISLSHDGNFGFEAVLSINMEKKNAGLYTNLFYFNSSSKQLELQSSGRIDENGHVEFIFTHASDYVAVVSTESALEKEMDQITINKIKGKLYVGGTRNKSMILLLKLPEQLEKLTKNSGSDFAISYQSSNPKVATVTASGNIIAKKAGKATITTVVTIAGVKKSFTTTIQVSNAYIKLTKSTKFLKKGKNYTFQVKGYGLNTEDIVFYTSKKSIIVINKTTGKAVAKSAGIDYVIARVGKVEVKIKVKVICNR